MSTIEERVKKIVVEQLGVKEDEVTTNASFVDDLGADSLDTVELVMALEEEFECEIPDEEAQKDHDGPAGGRLRQGPRQGLIERLAVDRRRRLPSISERHGSCASWRSFRLRLTQPAPAYGFARNTVKDENA